VDPGHELPRAILKAAERCGVAVKVDGMPASCDAWFYNNQLGIPTVVYGAGTLAAAHSKDERVALDEIRQTAEVLVGFVLDYCGTD